MANEAYEKDEIREAIEYYSYAIKYDPESSTSYCNRGFMKAELGKHKEAIKDYNSALKIDPSFTLPLYHKGRSLYFLENYQESLKIFEKLLEEEPNDKELQFYVNDLKKLI